ncbi:MAG: UDP-N-acetylmuramoyl-tripeptide--D-alanyl-D-alanine ligase [Bacteroidota bacterium]
MKTEELYSVFKDSTGVTTDTRKIDRGSLFFALKGENFDGNQFAGEALKKGALAVVVDEKNLQGKKGHILVEDTLKALQALANHYRKQFKIPFIGITGSNGKTTTKELITAVLKQKYNVLSTLGNLNNHIGVPLTLLQVDQSTEIAVIEMGANKIGDIAELVAIAQPNYGLITNIGKAHLEGFGSLEGVIRGKTELYDFLIKNEGKIFINTHNPILSNMIKRMNDPITYPGKNDFYACEFISADPYVRLLDETGNEVKSGLIGQYNFENIAVALCIGKYFGVDSDRVKKAIEEYDPKNNRSQIIKKPSCKIILDAYNANPSSMEGALADFKNIESEKKAVVLGDMNEVGKTSREEHKKVGQQVERLNLDLSVFVGEKMLDASKEVKSSKYFSDKNKLRSYLEELDFSKYAVLIKGSRSMGLEQAADWID